MAVSLSKRAIAAAELVLLSPAALFMSALLVRNLQQQQFELAHGAQRIVMWYAARPWTLWVLLMVLPLVVFAIGCATLQRSWQDDAELRTTVRHSVGLVRAHVATLLLAATTVVAAGVLVIVAVHALAD